MRFSFFYNRLHTFIKSTYFWTNGIFFGRWYYKDSSYICI